MTDKPLVSIVLQTYNRKDMLQCALESALNQTYKNIEILIGDNCSEDNTEEYCRQEEKKDTRIKYFRHKENIGMVGNANFLLDRVSGEYFIFLNDDDWLELDYVEKCIKFFQKNPDYSVVSPCVYLYPRTVVPSIHHLKKSIIVRLNQLNIRKRLLNYLKFQDLLEFSTGCFKTDILRKIKKEEGQYIIDRYNEDIVLIMKFLATGKAEILSDTHLNKRDEGYSRNLITCGKVYTVSEITRKNMIKKRCDIFSGAILTDKYFASILNERKLKKLYLGIYNGMQFHYGVGFYKIKGYYDKIYSTIRFILNHRLYI